MSMSTLASSPSLDGRGKGESGLPSKKRGRGCVFHPSLPPLGGGMPASGGLSSINRVFAESSCRILAPAYTEFAEGEFPEGQAPKVRSVYAVLCEVTVSFIESFYQLETRSLLQLFPLPSKLPYAWPESLQPHQRFASELPLVE